MNRSSTPTLALGILALLVGSWSASLWAEEVLLEPGWIAGQVDVATDGYKVQYLSVSAYGGGHQSSKSISQSYTGELTPLDYSLTVQGGDWDYTVNATATARPNPAYCPEAAPSCYQSYTNIYFDQQKFPVAIGETVPNDYAANGTIQFQLDITDASDPAIGNTINSWRAYGYARTDVVPGQERTNSRSYTHSVYTPCGIWDMPVVANAEVRVYASVTIHGTAYRDDLTTYNYSKSYSVYTSSTDYRYVDVGTDETNQVVVVPLQIEHVAPPSPPIPPIVTYDYGAVEGTVDLNLTVDGFDYSEQLFSYPASPYSRHYVYGYGGSNIYSNPGDYLINNVRTGTHTYRVRSYLYDPDYSQTFYWPYPDGDPTKGRVTVIKDQTVRKDFINAAGILTGQLLFQGSLKTEDLDWYQLQTTGSRIYEPGVGWINLPTYGGSSNQTVYPKQSDKSYRMFLTAGPWQPYYLRARVNNAELLGYSGWADLTLYDYNYYYDRNYYDFGQPVNVIGGVSTHENLIYKMGGVSLCFEVAGGGSLRSPSVYGSQNLYNEDGKREMHISISGGSNPDPNLFPNPEVRVYAPEGEYSLTPRAYTNDNTYITFPARQVTLNQKVSKRRCLTSPDMEIVEYIFDLTTETGTGIAIATVSGSTTDEDGILRIEFWLNGVKVHVIDYSATAQVLLLAQTDVPSSLLPTTANFSYDYELSAGLHTLRVVSVDGLGNESYDEWEVAVNSAPVASGDSFGTSEDTPLSIAVATLLANDSDDDGDVLSLQSFTETSQGALVDNGDGTFTYIPAENYWGSDSFSYTISDGRGGTATATVTIDVTPENDPPVAIGETYTTPEDVALVIGAPGLLANDEDIDGDPLTASLNTAPAHGTVTVNTDGSFSYTPSADYYGADSFTYVASDGNGGTNTASVSITVTLVDDLPPVCQLQAVNPGPPTSIQVFIEDTESGVQTIHVDIASNALVEIKEASGGLFAQGETASFLPPETNAFTVLGIKQNQTQKAQVQLSVTDAAGNAIACDPVVTLTVRETGKPVGTTFGGIPAIESNITIVNGNPGLKRLKVDVNGVVFNVNGLRNNEEHYLDVSSAMLSGDNNSITLTAYGKPGGSATVVISD